jgi:uncharacterized membrane protein
VLRLVKTIRSSRWVHPLLLLLWIAIGTVLRFGRLTSRGPWADEFSTMIFSLGHSFQTVPLDRAIALNDLLQPLQPDPTTGIGDVIHHLLTESNHPPLYFVLSHLWLNLFPTEGGIVSIWAARSLPALFGVASIPAMFGLGYLAFRSRLVGQMAAAMMAISPFGIFLAQEARHYTLPTLFAIASLCCLIVAARAIAFRTSFPLWVGLTWIVINTLGVATHFFFALTLCAEGMVLLVLAWRQSRRKTNLQQSFKSWRRIYGVAAGTLLGSLVWLPILPSDYASDNKLTHWIYDTDPLSNWLAPIGRVLAWAIAMLVALPMEITTLPLVLVIASGLVTLIFLFWALPILYRSLKLQQVQPDNRLSVQLLGESIIGVLVLFFGITYSLGADLTLAPRYQFVYFPALVALLGAALAACWNTPNPVETESKSFEDKATAFRLIPKGGKKAVMLICLMALLGGLTVAWNLSYLQTLRSDLLVKVIQQISNSPVLIATTYQHHGQTGRMMGLAWEFKRVKDSSNSVHPETASPLFLLAREPQVSQLAKNPTATLQETVAKLPRPLDIWLVNFHAGVELQQQNCFKVSQKLPKLDSYWYRLYRCPAPNS